MLQDVDCKCIIRRPVFTLAIKNGKEKMTEYNAGSVNTPFYSANHYRTVSLSRKARVSEGGNRFFGFAQ